MFLNQYLLNCEILWHCKWFLQEGEALTAQSWVINTALVLWSWSYGWCSMCLGKLYCDICRDFWAREVLYSQEKLGKLSSRWWHWADLEGIEEFAKGRLIEGKELAHLSMSRSQSFLLSHSNSRFATVKQWRTKCSRLVNVEQTVITYFWSRVKVNRVLPRNSVVNTEIQ